MTKNLADKNHEASALRRQKARTEGDCPRSFELAVALQVIGFTLVCFLALESISNQLSATTTQVWQITSAERLQGDVIAASGLEMVSAAMWAIAPMMLGCWMVVVASHWVQTGPMWLPGKASADASRMSPGHWWGQVASTSTWSYLFVGLPKFLVAIFVAAASFWYHRAAIFAIPFQPLNTMGSSIAEMVMQITFHVGLVLLASSAIDYWMHYLGYEKRIRMTDQELRDEMRMQDGDPTVNEQRKSLQSRFVRK